MRQKLGRGSRRAPFFHNSRAATPRLKTAPLTAERGHLDVQEPAAPGPTTAIALMHRAKRALFFLDLIAKIPKEASTIAGSIACRGKTISGFSSVLTITLNLAALCLIIY
jgi:hypothetical protein